MKHPIVASARFLSTLAFLFIVKDHAHATPWGQEPDHPLAPAVELDDKQALLQLGQIVPFHLQFIRLEDAQTLYVELEAIDAEVTHVPQANDPSLKNVEPFGSGDVYEFDLTALPVGELAEAHFNFKILGYAGAGVRARMWDDTGVAGEARMDFAVDENLVVTQAATPGDITLAQLARFQKADPWAQDQMEQEATIEWQPEPGDKDVYQTTHKRTDGMATFPKGFRQARKLSRVLHRDWNAGIDRFTGVRFSGRLVFPDSAGCASPALSHNITWSECHAIKRRIDASGLPITVDGYVEPAYRPLAATVTLSYEAWRDGLLERVCDVTTYQTDDFGRFLWEVVPCNVAPGPNLEFRLVGTAFLQNQVIGAPDDGDGDIGFVRAIWPVASMTALFPPEAGVTAIKAPSFIHRDGMTSTRYSVPAVRFTHVLAGPETAGSEVRVGMKILGAGPLASYNYLRQAMSAYATMVDLHLRMQDQVDLPSYLRLFDRETPRGRGFRASYLLWLDGSWAFGWSTGIRLLAPVKTPATRLLSDTGVLGHEFGHSVHMAMAGQSLAWDGGFAQLMRTSGPMSAVYDWGHASGQYQDMGQALVEGIGSTIGQYLFNGCRRSQDAARNIGAPAPSFAGNMWSGAGPDSAMQTAPPIHHFRWYLRDRLSVMEGSTAWNNRLTAVQNLTTNLTNAGHTLVKSNDEGRYANFGCDLLDDVTDVGYVPRFAPSVYAPDFTFEVWRAMTGANTDGSIGMMIPFQAPAGNETVQISLAELIDALANFCPTCATPPAAADYGTALLSVVTARQAPQVLARYLQAQGHASFDQLRDVLRANYMESAGLP